MTGPSLDAAGNLPVGVHPLAESNVVVRFGTGSPRREWLAERLRALLRLARDSGLVRRVYLWGSFVTAKPHPDDLDLLLVVKPGLTDDETRGPVLDLLDHERARLRFHADVFWVREDIGEQSSRCSSTRTKPTATGAGAASWR